MLLDILAVKLLENHLESIGETLFKTAFGNALTTARCCRMLRTTARLPATLLHSNARATRRGGFAPEANACGNVSMAKCWSGSNG
jgi:hypothetical protein